MFEFAGESQQNDGVSSARPPLRSLCVQQEVWLCALTLSLRLIDEKTDAREPFIARYYRFIGIVPVTYSCI